MKKLFPRNRIHSFQRGRNDFAFVEKTLFNDVHFQSTVQKRFRRHTALANHTLRTLLLPKAHWTEDGDDFAFLLQQDDHMRKFIEGIFYRMQIPMSELEIFRISDKAILLKNDLLIPEYILNDHEIRVPDDFMNGGLDRIVDRLYGQVDTPIEVGDPSVESMEDLEEHAAKAFEVILRQHELTKRNQKLAGSVEEIITERNRIIPHKLILDIEKSLTQYTQIPVYYLPNIHLGSAPFQSARLTAEFLKHALQGGISINDAVGELRKWQKNAHSVLKKLVPFEEAQNDLKSTLEKSFLNNAKVVGPRIEKSQGQSLYFPNHLSMKEFLILMRTKYHSVVGMEVTLKGVFKRGMRTERVVFNTFANDPQLTGRVKSTNLMADVDYYQTMARKSESTVGIKVLMMQRTIFQTKSGKDKTVVPILV